MQQIIFFVPIHFCRVPRSSVILENLQKNADAWNVFCQTQGRSAASAKSSSLPLGNFVSEVCPFASLRHKLNPLHSRSIVYTYVQMQKN